jgi:hypothetical protein
MGGGAMEEGAPKLGTWAGAGETKDPTGGGLIRTNGVAAEAIDEASKLAVPGAGGGAVGAGTRGRVIK